MKYFLSLIVLFLMGADLFAQSCRPGDACYRPPKRPPVKVYRPPTSVNIGLKVTRPQATRPITIKPRPTLSRPQLTLLRVNQERTKRGLNSLTYNETLAQAARHHSRWMKENGTMGHYEGNKPSTIQQWNSPNCTWMPLNRVARLGYLKTSDIYELGSNSLRLKPNTPYNVGEVVSHASPGSSGRLDPNIMVKGWMNSPPHRKTILGSYTEAGVGVSAAADGNVYWTVVFGKRPPR
jgi:uncharacterized protein YkwD